MIKIISTNLPFGEMVTVNLCIAFLVAALQLPSQDSTKLRDINTNSVESSLVQGNNPASQGHTLQFGTAYEPGPGPRIFAQYIYSGFPSGYTTADLGWARQLFGGLSYTHYFIPGRWGDRQATITPSVSTEYHPNRLLDGVETDERRTGGGLAGSLEFLLPAYWRYDQQLRVHYSSVRLSPEEGPVSYTSIAILETAPRLARNAIFGILPNDLLFEGRLLSGWDYESSSLFGRFRLGGRWHNTLGSGFALSTEVHGEWVTTDAPIFEQASFGGNFSVRGYRPDTQIGRLLGTAQQEVWIPVPGTTDAIEGFASILRSSFRFAAFFDAGVIQNTDSPGMSGFRSGAGLGARLRLGGITLRIDWGHRLHDLREGNFIGDFFVSIRPDQSLFLF
ncbi:MAG: BamA/TamA family outer membrane protein [Balneolales bacterium]